MVADIHIEFVSSALLEKRADSKMDYILECVRGNKILVLENPLSPEEEKNLIRETMKMVDRKFTGIEISTLGSDAGGLKESLIKMLGGKSRGLTVIGPSQLVRRIKRDPTAIHLFAHASK